MLSVRCAIVYFKSVCCEYVGGCVREAAELSFDEDMGTDSQGRERQ